MRDLTLGVDIGGTNTVFGIVSNDGSILYENTIATNTSESPTKLVIDIYNCLAKNTEHLKDIVGVGIGAPNGNYYTGAIEFAPNLKWEGIVPLVKIFEQRFGVKAVLSNDANAAAVGEQFFGVATDLQDFVTITLGTGLGSGIIINNELVYGSDSLAGEYGHIRVIRDGRSCGCGRKGCLETYVSATGVVRSIRDYDSSFKASSKINEILNPKAEDVFNLANQGDVFCTEIIDYTARVLGDALAEFACFSNPKAYVLFGGIAQSGDDFAQKVKGFMELGILNIYKGKIDIRISGLHHKNAAVLGAASLIRKELLK